MIKNKRQKMQAKYDNKKTFMEYSFHFIYMYYGKKRHTALHIMSFLCNGKFSIFLNERV